MSTLIKDFSIFEDAPNIYEALMNIYGVLKNIYKGAINKKHSYKNWTTFVNPAKRKAMAVKNEKRFLKQKRNALKNPGYSHHPVKTQASFKRLLKAVWTTLFYWIFS